MCIGVLRRKGIHAGVASAAKPSEGGGHKSSTAFVQEKEENVCFVRVHILVHSIEKERREIRGGRVHPIESSQKEKSSAEADVR